MGTPGKTVLRQGGKRGIVPGGRTGVYDADGTCTFCCGCKPEVLASKVTNYYDPNFDLTPYQGNGVGPAGGFWRLVETGHCLVYNRGCIDQHGKLVGLPALFHSAYVYNGYMELQIGCLGDDALVHYPGTCLPTEARGWYPC